MCCRIYRSHPLTRVIEGLYILLATFLIGFFAVQAVSWIDSNHTPACSAFSLESADRDPDLLIRYERTRAISDTSVIAIYRVTNTNPSRIYFDVDKETYKMPAFVSDNLDGVDGTSVEVTNRELDPGESGELWVTLREDARDFTFRVGFVHNGASRSVTVKTSNDLAN